MQITKNYPEDFRKQLCLELELFLENKGIFDQEEGEDKLQLFKVLIVLRQKYKLHYLRLRHTHSRQVYLN